MDKNNDDDLVEITIRLPDAVLLVLDEYAKKERKTRDKAIFDLLMIALPTLEEIRTIHFPTPGKPS